MSVAPAFVHIHKLSACATYFAAAPDLSAVGERKGGDRVNSEGVSGG